MKTQQFRVKPLLLLLLLSCLVFSGCSGKSNWFRDRSHDYKTVKDGPRLQIPEEMSVETFSDTYDVSVD